MGVLRECERPKKGAAARPSTGKSLGCQSSEGVTRVRPFVESVQQWPLVMETGLMVVRMTMVVGPVTTSVVPWWLVSLVVVKPGLMMAMMTTVAQGWAS